MPGFATSATLAFLVTLSSGAATPQGGFLLTDPARSASRVTAEHAWTLRLDAAQPPGKTRLKGLVALARPCSNWVDELRTRSPDTAQGLFELCVERAMDDDFAGVAVVPHHVGAGSATIDRDTAKLAAVMRIELDCVGWVAQDFDVLEQEDFRAETNSWHVAQRKVSLTKRCLSERLEQAGLRQFAAYHYSRSRAKPRDH